MPKIHHANPTASVCGPESKCELTLSILAKGPRWACTLEYPGDLFTAATVGRMAGHWQELLRSFTVTPEAPICRLNLLSAIERQQLLVEWNRTERDYPRDQCIHRLFEEQVARTQRGWPWCLRAIR